MSTGFASQTKTMNHLRLDSFTACRGTRLVLRMVSKLMVVSYSTAWCYTVRCQFELAEEVHGGFFPSFMARGVHRVFGSIRTRVLSWLCGIFIIVAAAQWRFGGIHSSFDVLDSVTEGCSSGDRAEDRLCVFADIDVARAHLVDINMARARLTNIDTAKMRCLRLVSRFRVIRMICSCVRMARVNRRHGCTSSSDPCTACGLLFSL